MKIGGLIMRKKIINATLTLIFSLLTFSCASPYSDESSTEKVYYDKEGLKYTLSDDGKGYFVGNGTNTDVVVHVPQTYNGLPVIGVSYQGFFSTEIEEIYLPDTVEIIESDAFFECKNLKSFNSPKSLKVIERSAFYFCVNLKKVNLEEELKIIGSSAFGCCKSLEYINIPEGVEEIGFYAFQFTSSLKKLSLPNSLKHIEDIGPQINPEVYNYHNNAYYLGNENNPYIYLSAINIQKNVIEIENGCRFLGFNHYPYSDEKPVVEKIILPNTVEKIYNVTQYNSLIEITGDCKVSYINDCAFYRYERLQSVITLKYCEIIGNGAFENCFNLSDKIDLSSIVELGSRAFSYCLKIKEVVLGKNLQAIKYLTFRKCTRLETIYIPKSIKQIEYDAFNECNNLKNIYYEGNEEEWNSIKIDDTNLEYLSNAEIHFNTIY